MNMMAGEHLGDCSCAIYIELLNDSAQLAGLVHCALILPCVPTITKNSTIAAEV